MPNAVEIIAAVFSVYEVETSFLQSTEYINSFLLLINDRQRNNK